MQVTPAPQTVAVEETIRVKTVWTRLLHSKPAIIGLVIIAAILIFVLIGPYVWPYTAFQVSGPANSPPSFSHPFGTDYQGHDLMSQVIYGAYPTLLVGLVSSVCATMIGFVAALYGGYFERVRNFVSLATDIVLSFPSIAMLIVIGSLFLPSDPVIAGGLIVLLWATCSRAILPQVASLKRMPYVEAAKTSGMSNRKIQWRIIAPAVAPIAMAYFILITSVGIIIATSVSFLGLGNFTVISWGTIFFYAQEYAFYLGDWWWVIAPGLMLALTASAFALVGFSVEEIMNPRLRK
ncbi:MAG: ABC transporter permease [Nitrososphaerales archaeon]